MALTTQQQSDLISVYIAAFDRAPDADGLDFWANSIINGVNPTVTDVANAIFNDQSIAEVNANYSDALTNEQFVTKIYQNVFNREPDAEGLAFWAGAMNSGINSRGETVVEMFKSLSNPGSEADKALFDNKVAVGEYFAIEVGSNGVALAREALESVTEDPASVDTAKAAIDGVDAVGENFTLTTGSDNLTGTSGNDTITGTYDGATTSTFNVSDVLAGGAGTDVLNITATADAAKNLPGALVSGIETVNIRNVDGDSGADVLTVNASNFVGATSFNADRSTDSVKFSSLGTGAAIGVIGNGTVVGGAVAADYATTTDAVTLNIADGTKMTNGVTVTGTATTATINSTGAANTIGTVDLANGSLTSVNINAAANLKGDLLSQATDQVGTDGAVTISGAATTVELTAALDDTIKTINASGLTAGGVKATLGTGTEDYKGGAGADTITLAAGVKTATFGAGDDVVTTAAVAATTAGAISGGDGMDTLVVAAATDVDTAAERAVYAGFETLRNKAAGASLDMDGFAGITAVEAEGAFATTFSNMTAAQAGAVKVMGAATTLTLGLKDGTGTADVATVTIGDTKTDSDILTDLVANTFETINIVSAGTKAGTDVTVEKITSDTATNISISGSVKDGTNALFKLNDTSGLAKAVTIDASDITDGALTLGANNGVLVKGSSVVGTALKDTVTTGAVVGTTGDFVSINTGASDDTVKSTAAIINNTSAANGSLKIEGGAGTDTLELTAAGAMVDASFQYVTGFEKITNSGTNQAVDITTGGFFNTNFAGGVEFSTNSGTANTSINATSFTGNVTAATNVAANGNTTVITGSGGDKVTVTSAGTGTVNVETGLGNDTVAMAASAATGTTTIDTGVGDDTITGVVVDATITGGTGADAITVGAAVQTIVIGNTDSGITVATADTITGFKAAGADKLKMGTAGDATAGTGTYVEAAAAVADFAAALTAANTALAALAGTSAATELYSFQFDATNGYLFNDTDGNGTADQVIVLVGIDNTEIDAADIIL